MPGIPDCDSIIAWVYGFGDAGGGWKPPELGAPVGDPVSAWVSITPDGENCGPDAGLGGGAGGAVGPPMPRSCDQLFEM
jgi:hypothetical protein